MLQSDLPCTAISKQRASNRGWLTIEGVGPPHHEEHLEGLLPAVFVAADGAISRVEIGLGLGVRTHARIHAIEHRLGRRHVQQHLRSHQIGSDQIASSHDHACDQMSW